jgi:L-alanine-DL-glutamate epimerase-like enolase superfamily enzyme
MKIASVRAIPVSQVVRKRFAIVSAAGSQPESHFVVVEIRGDDGTAGYGEASVVQVWSGESQPGAVHAIENILAPALVGRDPLHAAALADEMDRVLVGNPFTKAGVEMALLDLAGRLLNTPVSTLLGGPLRGPEIPLKFSIGAMSPERAAEVGRAAAEMGIRAVKVKVGLDLRTDIARVQAVRSALGEDFAIGVDANGGWSESEALNAIPHLEKLRVNAFEQPLARGDFRGCARLRRRTSIPIMLDESIFTRRDALEVIRLDACDLFSIYPGKNGGIRRSMEIAQMAANAGLECIIGSNLEMDLGSAAMLHLAASAPALSASVHHDIIGPLYYDRRFSSPGIQFRNGCAVLPDGPGLGLRFDASA